MKVFGLNDLTSPKVKVYDEPTITRETYLKGTVPTPDEFSFKLSKFQGKSERGKEGIVELLKTQEAIEDTVKWLLKEHGDWAKETLKMHTKQDTQVKPLTHDEIHGDGFFRSFIETYTPIEGQSAIRDGIELNDATLSFEEKRATGEELSFHVAKWQGDKIETGKLGVLSLLTIKDQIDATLKFTHKYFPEFLKEARKDFEASNTKDASSLEMQ